MEDPAFRPPDLSPVRRRLWLLAALLIITGGYLIDQKMPRRDVQPARPLKMAAVLPFAPPSAPPSKRGRKNVEPIAALRRVNAQYLRQVRQTHHLYHPIIKRAAWHFGVDPALVKAIIMAESGYNPKAVSQSGALGLMQLMPSTAQSLGVVDSFDPEHNITAGVRYFRKLMNLVADDPALALAAYNAGPAKVRRYKGIPPYQATRHYIRKVLDYYYCYRHISQEKDISSQS